MNVTNSSPDKVAFDWEQFDALSKGFKRGLYDGLPYSDFIKKANSYFGNPKLVETVAEKCLEDDAFAKSKVTASMQKKGIPARLNKETYLTFFNAMEDNFVKANAPPIFADLNKDMGWDQFSEIAKRAYPVQFINQEATVFSRTNEVFAQTMRAVNKGSGTSFFFELFLLRKFVVHLAAASTPENVAGDFKDQ